MSTVIAAPATTYKLSSEQHAIAKHVDKGIGNMIVRARAGTGKTHMILQCLPLMKHSIAILAFNRKIAEELKAKVAKAGHRHVEVSTFHAIGDRVIRKLYPQAKLEGRGKDNAGYYKFDRIAEELDIPKYLHAFVKKTMAMAMLHGVGIGGLMAAKDITTWQHLVKHYGIDTEIADDNVVMQLRGREQLILEGLRFAHQAVVLGKKIAHEVYSYDDMLWLPLIVNAALPKYDWLCVDEAQDTNPVRREMVRRMMHSKTRLLFVGDDRQSIYGFTGADCDSLDIIQREFTCSIFPMTMTFRCGKAIVALAQGLVPDYKAAPGNPVGSVSTISEADFNKMTLVPGEDAIICRNTRPLVTAAYGLIKRGIAAHIEGREIGTGLLALVNRWPGIKTIPALVTKLGEYRDREMTKLSAAKQEMQADALNDKVETVLAIIEGLPKEATLINALREKIDAMFSDTPDGAKAASVMLMTAHRSKGLEFPRVFGWGVPSLMPSKRATQPHEVLQEKNLEYVLYTRAIQSYVDVLIED